MIEVTTGQLMAACETYGPESGRPVVLLHGFPYSVDAYSEVGLALAADGWYVVVPHLRGFGATHFKNDDIPRSGEQAAMGQDLIDLIEALGLERPVVAGYDWGGRAACIAAAVRPDLVRGLVSVCGYNIFGPPVLGPVDPAFEHILWYQYYLHTHRGRMMLEQKREAFCRYLWTIWSAGWNFDDATFARSAAAFANPDFVEVVLHSYRHRSGLVPGDPAHVDLAKHLESLPPVSVPTVVLHGDRDCAPLAMSADKSRFTGPYERRIVPGAGHNLPQEAPDAMIAAVRALAVS